MTRYLLAALLLVPTFGWAAGNYSSTAHSPAYGCIREVNTLGGESTITVETAGQYYQWTTADVDLGLSTGGTTVVTGSNAIEIGADGGGVYVGNWNVSLVAPNNATVEILPALEGVAQEVGHGMKKFASTARIDTMESGAFYIRLIPTSTLTLVMTSSTNGDVLTIEHASLCVERIGP